MQGFQFTTSQGGRLTITKSMATQMAFQFTTSQGGRLYSEDTETITLNFQFTTSQGGRHDEFLLFKYLLILSIHDLTRRSTWKWW